VGRDGGAGMGVSREGHEFAMMSCIIIYRAGIKRLSGIKVSWSRSIVHGHICYCFVSSLHPSKHVYRQKLQFQYHSSQPRHIHPLATLSGELTDDAYMSSTLSKQPYEERAKHIILLIPGPLMKWRE
jgi:hypothetical protein